MCGIAGEFILHGASATTARDWPRLTQLMAQRGPDDSGVWQAPDAACTLAFRRLSILDLTPAGHQPMFDHTGRFALVFNGEIYNFRTLRQELEALGCRFQSTGDTEVVLQALAHWGTAALKRFRGMFALAFYDHLEHRLLLARDRLGIKPLYWCQHNDTLLFASTIKVLAQACPLKLDPIRCLYALASTAEASTHLTLFTGVHAIEPGTSMVCSREHGTQIERYFHLLDLVSPERYRANQRQSAAALDDEFTAVFSAGIARMLVSDAPLGMFVSGGVDSALITAVASQSNPGLNLYSVDVQGSGSERAATRGLAERLKLPIHFTEYHQEDYLFLLAATTWEYETPIIYFENAVPFSLVAALAHQQGIKVALTGEGSDELFLGYPEPCYHRYLEWLHAPLRGYEAMLGMFPPIQQVVFGRNNKLLLPNLLAENLSRRRHAQEMRQRYQFLPPVEAQYQTWSSDLLQHHLLALLHRNDRMGMMHSIEARFPFLDEEMVAFAMNLPIRQKMAFSHRFHSFRHPFIVDKAIVRRVATRLLPKATAYRRKWGFGVHGLAQYAIPAAAFKDGFVLDLLQIRWSDFSGLYETFSSNDRGRLLALETFGHLFQDQWTPETVTSWLLETCRQNPA
jgi:asparagine synthase (glutamine-hydrolysing)